LTCKCCLIIKCKVVLEWHEVSFLSFFDFLPSKKYFDSQSELCLMMLVGFKTGSFATLNKGFWSFSIDGAVIGSEFGSVFGDSSITYYSSFVWSCSFLTVRMLFCFLWYSENCSIVLNEITDEDRSIIGLALGNFFLSSWSLARFSFSLSSSLWRVAILSADCLILISRWICAAIS